jgi:hypothetical protein
MRASRGHAGQDPGKAPGQDPGRPSELIRVAWKMARTPLARFPGMRQPPRLADAAADAPAGAGIGDLLRSL